MKERKRELLSLQELRIIPRVTPKALQAMPKSGAGAKTSQRQTRSLLCGTYNGTEGSESMGENRMIYRNTPITQEGETRPLSKVL